MPEYRYDTQLLIEGADLDEDTINDYFVESFQGGFPVGSWRRRTAQEHMLAACPSLQAQYKPGDGNTEVYYLIQVLVKMV